MPSDVLLEKAESIRRCIGRIESRMPVSATELASDLDSQDIISVNLQRAVQLAVDIAAIKLAEYSEAVQPSMAELFRALGRAGAVSPELAERMARAVGFRNIAVHEYTRIDWGIVHSIVHRHLDDFRQFIKQTVT